MEITFSLDEIDAVAQKVVSHDLKKIVLFHGAMGVGKTTFIKALSKQLGVSESTSSPTFSLVNEYPLRPNEFIYHFDVYRLKNENEALDFGIDDYFYSGNWCFIEWAENIPNLIPNVHSSITIELLPDGKRRLILT